jgi:hypothetical protein
MIGTSVGEPHKAHHDDVPQSLAALSPASGLPQELRQISDDERRIDQEDAL